MIAGLCVFGLWRKGIINRLAPEGKLHAVQEAFLDATRYFAQFRGASENLHVVERFTRTGPNTLLYRFTVDDPSTWEKSWTGEYPWNATKENLYEYACHEGNYSLGGMLRGARQKEAEDAKKSK